MTAPTTDPPLAPAAGWPDLSRFDRPDRGVAVAVIAAAIGTDLAVRSGITGLAGYLLVLVLVGGLAASGRIANRRAWVLLAAAVLLGAGLVVRAASWLQALDVLAMAGLLVLASSMGQKGDPFDLSVPDVMGRGVHASLHGVLAPGFVAKGVRGGGRRATGTLAAIRGLLLAVPIVLVIGLLLGSADPVFASFFRIPTGVDDLVVHAVLLGVGAWGSAGLFRTASAEPYAVPTAGRRFLGAIESTTVLVGLVLVFSAFTVSQVMAVLGGADYVRRTAGLSYAEYARNGFFQLLAAAVITLAVLLAVRASAQVRDRRFLVLSETAVGLTLVMVAGALRRLGLYEQAYGLTLLRLLSVAFALWVGGVFVLLGLSLAGVHRRRQWFVPAAAALGLAGLLVLHVVNPEAVIVRRNVDRLAGTERFDPYALGDLSGDAVPALAAALDRLSAADAAVVRDRICRGPHQTSGGLWAYNAARDKAIEARNKVC